MARILLIGLGPLGVQVARFAAGRAGIELVGAADIDPALVGRDLGRHCGLPRMGIPIRDGIAAAARGARAECAVLTTVSRLAALEPQVAEAARCGLDVVSTCEELVYPWRTAPALAARINAVCRRHGVTCLGTGVNPGFMMDFLPSVLTAVSRQVRQVRVWRVQDAAPRRLPFRRKIGAGLTRAEFRARAAAGALRHVGLAESAHMIARALDWELGRVTESIRPVIASSTLPTDHGPIAPGQVCGVEQVGRGYIGRREAVRLHFRAAVGEPRSFDRIEIRGRPDTIFEIEGGIHGDVATCAIVLNAVRSVLAAAPGLKTMLDVPAVTWSG